MLLLLDYIVATTNAKALLISSDISDNMKIEEMTIMTIEIQWFRIHVQSYNNPEKKPRESEEDDGPTAESSNNWMLCGRVCYFIPASKKKKQSNFRHTDKKPKRGKKGKRIFHVSLQMLGIFVLFLGFVVVAVVVCLCTAISCASCRGFFLSFPLTTRDLIFCIYFLFVFLLSFWYRGKSRCERARTATNVRHTAVDTFATAVISRVKKNKHNHHITELQEEINK